MKVLLLISLNRSNLPKEFFGAVLVNDRIMWIRFSKLLQQIEIDILFMKRLAMDVLEFYNSLVSFNCLPPLWSEKQILLIRSSPSSAIVVGSLTNCMAGIWDVDQ